MAPWGLNISGKQNSCRAESFAALKNIGLLPLAGFCASPFPHNSPGSSSLPLQLASTERVAIVCWVHVLSQQSSLPRTPWGRNRAPQPLLQQGAVGEEEVLG